MQSAGKTLGRVLGIAALLVAAVGLSAVETRAGTLDQIRKTATIRIAYREDAPPFSVKGTGGAPDGFIVELCRSVAADIGQQLALPDLHVVYVPVTSVDRFAAIQNGKADLLCEATTETLSRRKLVDFSIPTFVDGASLLIRSDGPTSLAALAGQKIGVLGGTTTEVALRNTLKDQSISADVVIAKSHDDGLQMLKAGTISAYFADRAILQFLQLEATPSANLALSTNYLTIELYALALRHGDEEFRLAVDTALSRIYRSGQIIKIFRQTFGDTATPSDIVKTLYAISGLQQ